MSGRQSYVKLTLIILVAPDVEGHVPKEGEEETTNNKGGFPIEIKPQIC